MLVGYLDRSRRVRLSVEQALMVSCSHGAIAVERESEHAKDEANCSALVLMFGQRGFLAQSLPFWCRGNSKSMVCDPDSQIRQTVGEAVGLCFDCRLSFGWHALATRNLKYFCLVEARPRVFCSASSRDLDPQYGGSTASTCVSASGSRLRPTTRPVGRDPQIHIDLASLPLAKSSEFGTLPHFSDRFSSVNLDASDSVWICRLLGALAIRSGWSAG